MTERETEIWDMMVSGIVVFVLGLVLLMLSPEYMVDWLMLLAIGIFCIGYSMWYYLRNY